MMDKKLDRISANQVIQGESINILALRQLQTQNKANDRELRLITGGLLFFTILYL